MKIDYENIHEDLLFSLLGAMLWCASTLGNVSDKGAHRCPCLPQVTCAYRTVEEMALLFSQKVSRRMIEALKESWLEIGRERREEESSSCTQQSWGERQERGGLLRGYLPPTPPPSPVSAPHCCPGKPSSSWNPGGALVWPRAACELPSWSWNLLRSLALASPSKLVCMQEFSALWSS